jgi:serine/threonine protein kinase
VHRDLKPKNIVVSLQDPQEFNLIDLGLADKYMVSKVEKHQMYCDGQSRQIENRNLKGPDYVEEVIDAAK